MTPSPTPHRAGFAAILGNPNAGKSTLMNALVGEKLAAVSGLPQTTRDRINGIVSGDDYQIIFVDLPGLVQADDKLNESLRNTVLDTLNGVDVVIHLVDPSDRVVIGADMAAISAGVRVPMILAVSKADRRPRDFDVRKFADSLAPSINPERYAAILSVSAVSKTGTKELIERVRGLLPEAPPFFDPDDLTDRSMRFLAAEAIREKVFQFTHEELPYATAVEIIQFDERPGEKWFIAAEIHVEHDSQKGLMLGKGGAMLKKISMNARKDIEQLCGSPIYLDLHVKVSENWRRSDARLREFGYKPTLKKRKRK